MLLSSSTHTHVVSNIHFSLPPLTSPGSPSVIMNRLDALPSWGLSRTQVILSAHADTVQEYLPYQAFSSTMQDSEDLSADNKH